MNTIDLQQELMAADAEANTSLVLLNTTPEISDTFTPISVDTYTGDTLGLSREINGYEEDSNGCVSEEHDDLVDRNMVDHCMKLGCDIILSDLVFGKLNANPVKSNGNIEG